MSAMITGSTLANLTGVSVYENGISVYKYTMPLAIYAKLSQSKSNFIKHTLSFNKRQTETKTLHFVHVLLAALKNSPRQRFLIFGRHSHSDYQLPLLPSE